MELRSDRRDETVRVAGRAPGIVASRQMVHERRGRHSDVAGIRPTDRVHDPVTVREEKPALLPGRVSDGLHRPPRVAGALDQQQELADVARAGGLVGKPAALLGVGRRRRLSLPTLSITEKTEGGGRGADCEDEGNDGGDQQSSAFHARMLGRPRKKRAAPEWGRSSQLDSSLVTGVLDWRSRRCLAPSRGCP
jgi:hypothetical protein